MAKRMQSPSSINLYKQCPRKYFYQYIIKLPTKPSIHLIRGFIVHEVLEEFFKIDIASLDKGDYKYGFRSYVMSKLAKLWGNSKDKLLKLGLTTADLDFYYVDSQEMLTNFIDSFSEKLGNKLKGASDLEKAFKQLTPSVEEKIQNIDLQVRGFIDAIHDDNGEIVIMDYKTSKKDDMTPAYRLQLGIYALLYQQKYNKTPSKVGINFLKFGERMIDVDDSLINEAKHEIQYVHEMTVTDNIIDYPRKESGLCKWRTGQCDFYNECFKDR